MKHVLSGILLLVICVLLALNTFIVPEGKQAARLTTAQPTTEPTWLEPGVYFRWPIGQHIVWRDQRQQAVFARGTEAEPYVTVNTFDQHALELGYVALWQVKHFATFNRHFADDTAAQAQIRLVLNQALSQCCLSQTLAQWLNPEGLANILQQVTLSANKALAEYGITLSQVQITALVVPPVDQALWFNGMKARGQETLNQLQSQTATLATNLHVAVEQKVAQTLMTAKNQAAQLHQQADAQATALYADAYRRNPAFYEFYMNLKAYRQVFKAHPPVLVLNTDTPFLKSLNNP